MQSSSTEHQHRALARAPGTSTSTSTQHRAPGTEHLTVSIIAYRPVRVRNERRRSTREARGDSSAARNDSSPRSGSRSGSFRARPRFSGLIGDRALEVGDRLDVFAALGVGDGQHVERVIVVGVLVAHQTEVRQGLVVPAAVDRERRREQPLVDGLRRRFLAGRLALTDVQVQPDPLVQLLFLGVLSAARTRRGAAAADSRGAEAPRGHARRSRPLRCRSTAVADGWADDERARALDSCRVGVRAGRTAEVAAFSLAGLDGRRCFAITLLGGKMRAECSRRSGLT